MDLRPALEHRSALFWSLVGLLLIAVVGLVDLWTGYELGFSIFYLGPVTLVTWYGGRRLGIAAALVSAIVWFAVDVGSGHPYSHEIYYYWNSAIRFGFFLTVALLLSALQRALSSEKTLARTDGLTGTFNSRAFGDLLRAEIGRLERYGRPFTLVYFDLDHFKQVNDRLGHSVGDEVLHAIALVATLSLRRTDSIARLGGDEFAILLPETDGPVAQGAVAKLNAALLVAMEGHGWPVTFSIGVVTCLEAPTSSDEIIKHADQVMYRVKNEGKNGIAYSTYGG